MAQANNSLQVTELGFFEIKNNLKNFLRAKSEFTDFDFEGSTMSYLLDVLAYNTYYQSFYLNMIANESFLDSATMSASVNSIAKTLNYLPRSTRSAFAQINVAFTPNDSPSEIVIPKYSKFTTTINGVNYTFTTATDYSVVNQSGAYIKSIDLYEGLVLSYRFSVSNPSAIFEIPVDGVDTESLIVEVQDNASSTAKSVYTFVTDATEVNATAKVYYLQKNSNNYYELYFGDDILGKKIAIGNVITATFRAANGSAPNNAGNFQPIGYTGYSKDIPTNRYVATVLSVTTRSKEGQNEEDIESIKFNAPRSFETQNRLITPSDYKNYLSANYSDIQSVNVWGGEDNIPPLFGKTMIAIKPVNGYVITDSRKLNIITEIQKYTPMAIDPVIIDPVFLFVNPSILVNYNSSVSTLNVEGIFGKISSAVQNYETSQLGIFGNRFKQSKLSTIIDNADNSIESNEIELKIEKRFAPVLNSKFNYNLVYQNRLRNPYAGYFGCITSTGFKIAGFDTTLFLDDDGFGKLRLYYLSGTTKTYYRNDVGSVDYLNGKVSLMAFTFTDYDEEVIVSAQPHSSDIYSDKNQIILLSSPNITMFDSNKNRIIYTDVVDVLGNNSLVAVDGVSNLVTL